MSDVIRRSSKLEGDDPGRKRRHPRVLFAARSGEGLMAGTTQRCSRCLFGCTFRSAALFGPRKRRRPCEQVLVMHGVGACAASFNGCAIHTNKYGLIESVMHRTYVFPDSFLRKYLRLPRKRFSDCLRLCI